MINQVEQPSPPSFHQKNRRNFIYVNSADPNHSSPLIQKRNNKKVFNSFKKESKKELSVLNELVRENVIIGQIQKDNYLDLLKKDCSKKSTVVNFPRTENNLNKKQKEVIVLNPTNVSGKVFEQKNIGKKNHMCFSIPRVKSNLFSFRYHYL